MAVKSKKCYWCAEQVGNINLLANIGLFFVKLAGGVFGHSQALIADALHSSSDIIVSLLLIAGLKITGAPPDDDHPWGHGHIEFIVASLIGGLLLFAGTLIVTMAIVSIFENEVAQPGILAVWAALISIVANEIMYRHSLCIGNQMESPAMLANAWENKADAYTSIAALIGVFGARLGFSFLDPVAAIFVGYFISKTAISTLFSAINGITDGRVEDHILAKLKNIIRRDSNIKSIVNLRARKIGQKVWVDLEALFDPNQTVREVNQAIGHLTGIIMGHMDNVGGVHVIPLASKRSQ